MHCSQPESTCTWKCYMAGCLKGLGWYVRHCCQGRTFWPAEHMLTWISLTLLWWQLHATGTLVVSCIVIGHTQSCLNVSCCGRVVGLICVQQGRRCQSFGNRDTPSPFKTDTRGANMYSETKTMLESYPTISRRSNNVPDTRNTT